MRISSILGLAFAALAASVSVANAQQRVQVGVITCEGDTNVGYIVGSMTQLHCIFSAEGRRPEPYIANVQRIGLDIGVTDRTGLAWAVFAPTYRVGPGDLAGSYGGVGGNASVGVGGGGNLLFGGSANSYTLQPLSLQGQTGLNVTGGIVGVTLHQEGIYPARRYHHRRHKR